MLTSDLTPVEPSPATALRVHDKLDEMMAFSEEWRQRFPDMGPCRVLVCADRDNEGTIVTVVEFPSYEAAMKNNEDPVTAEFAERMQSLSDAPPTFRNLDPLKIEER